MFNEIENYENTLISNLQAVKLDFDKELNKLGASFALAWMQNYSDQLELRFKIAEIVAFFKANGLPCCLEELCEVLGECEDYFDEQIDGFAVIEGFADKVMEVYMALE